VIQSERSAKCGPRVAIRGLRASAFPDEDTSIARD
jgi:hypothetical protein